MLRTFATRHKHKQRIFFFWVLFLCWPSLALRNFQGWQANHIKSRGDSKMVPLNEFVFYRFSFSLFILTQVFLKETLSTKVNNANLVLGSASRQLPFWHAALRPCWLDSLLLAYQGTKDCVGREREYNTPSPYSETGQRESLSSFSFHLPGRAVWSGCCVLKIEHELDWPDCWFRMCPRPSHSPIYAFS